MVKKAPATGEVRNFRGPSRIVGRSVRLWNVLEYIGPYEDHGNYELNKLAELRFGDRAERLNALSVIGLDASVTDRRLGKFYVPKVIVADNPAVLALMQGKTAGDIKVESLGRVSLRDAYMEPLYIDNGGEFIRPQTDEDRENSTTISVNLQGEVRVAVRGPGDVWIDADWHQAVAVPRQRPQTA